MKLVSLYTYLIILASVSFEITILNATINLKEVFRDFNDAHQSEITLHNQETHETPRQMIEITSTMDIYIKPGRRTANINNNRMYQNVMLTKKMIEIDSRHRRRKRDSNESNCHGLCRSSLCQWTERWDFDSSRNPAFIPKAECSSQCNVNSVTVVIPKIINIYTACEPIKTGMLYLI